jgi:hypothetical protein
VDVAGELLDAALAAGVLQKRGLAFHAGDEFLGVSRPAALLRLQHDGDLSARLREAVIGQSPVEGEAAGE